MFDMSLLYLDVTSRAAAELVAELRPCASGSKFLGQQRFQALMYMGVGLKPHCEVVWSQQ